MRATVLALLAVAPFLLGSCFQAEDPDLNPQPTVPKTSYDTQPRNVPVPGQGGGAMGVLPKEPRR